MKIRKILILTWLPLLAAMFAACQKPEKQPEKEVSPVMTSPAKIERDKTVSSAALGKSVKYSAWLPPTYDETKTYPVLFLVHGYENDPTDAHNKWLSTESFYGTPNGGDLNTIATAYVRDGGELFVIVTPNCPNDFYRDYPEGDKYETFFIQEFIPAIETKYHGNGKRAIAGLSMGGYGTLFHGFRHPEMFTVMYAMSPATAFYGEPQPTLASLVAGATPAQLPKITVETGTGDGTVSLSSVQDFVKLMKDHGIQAEFITRSGGHDWSFWQGCLPKALRLAGQSFK